jgi:hypothetical protein
MYTAYARCSPRAGLDRPRVAAPQGERRCSEQGLILNSCRSPLCDAMAFPLQAGASPLMISSQAGHESVVLELLSAGADVNVCGEKVGASHACKHIA